MVGWMALELLSRGYSADHVVPSPDVERVQHLRLCCEARLVGEILNNFLISEIIVESFCLAYSVVYVGCLVSHVALQSRNDQNILGLRPYVEASYRFPCIPILEPMMNQHQLKG